MKFTKTIRKNKIRPKDGSEPLTVVEFSLTNDVRDALKKAIDEYRVSKEDNVALAKIITDHFPKEVLEELRALSVKGGSVATVYVVKNLPEITKEQIPDKFLNLNQKGYEIDYYDRRREWFEKNAYSPYIGRGVGLAILGNKDLEKDFGHLARYKNWRRSFFTDGVAGEDLHRHSPENMPITILGGVFSNGAATRFIDMRTILEAKRPITEKLLALWNDEQKVTAQVTGSKGEKLLPLKKLPKRYPDWNDANAISLHSHKSPGKKGYPDFFEDHMCEVVVGAGDLALWAEDGKMFHQALPGPESKEVPNGQLTRYVVFHGLQRPLGR